MQTLNLKKIVASANLKIPYLGSILFPNNLEPRHAIYRVMQGHALLNSEQIAKLAELLNVPIGLLFDGAPWELTAHTGRINIINFTAYDYFAELDLSTMQTTLFRKDVKLFSTVVSHDKTIGLTGYFALLTDLIIKHK